MTRAADSRWSALARTKLHRICGIDRGEALLRDALATAGLEELRSPDDLATIARVLVAQGGFVEAVGHALQFQATLHGARSGP